MGGGRPYCCTFLPPPTVTPHPLRANGALFFSKCLLWLSAISFQPSTHNHNTPSRPFFRPHPSTFGPPDLQNSANGGAEIQKKTCLKCSYKCPESPSQSPFRRHVFFRFFANFAFFPFFSKLDFTLFPRPFSPTYTWKLTWNP